MPETVHDAVDVRKVLPNETTDPRVSRDDFVTTVSGLVTSGRAAHTAVVDKRLCDMGNFGLKNKGNITVKDWDRTCPALGQAGILQRAQWRLKCGQVPGFDRERAMVIADEEVEERKAGSTCETFCELLNKRQDCRIFNSDLV